MIDNDSIVIGIGIVIGGINMDGMVGDLLRIVNIDTEILGMYMFVFCTAILLVVQR